ncbi:MAG: Polyprenyl synthetase [Proteobacteria bacterium]|nr:Polyprenyl synthetase [Pseudomonadota bacterium]
MPLPDTVSALVADDLNTVDDIIRERLRSEVPLIRQVAQYIVSGGGKRLRPILLLLAAGASGYRGKLHLELAAVIEIIHTATLLHDDVVDESDLRRGRQTANALFGNAASVLVGDFLHSRSFQMMVDAGNPKGMRVLADATSLIAEGEVLQLAHCHDANVDEERYLQVIRYKTAKLFEAAARLGGILGDDDGSAEAALGEYGTHLGTAFQIVDDVLDYSGDEEQIGKQVGDDLAEGKPTLPLIHVLRHGTPEQAVVVRQAIESGGRALFPEVLAAVRSSGALQHALDLAEHESLAARNAIVCLADTKYKKALLELTVFAAQRNN